MGSALAKKRARRANLGHGGHRIQVEPPGVAGAADDSWHLEDPDPPAADKSFDYADDKSYKIAMRRLKMRQIEAGLGEK